MEVYKPRKEAKRHERGVGIHGQNKPKSGMLKKKVIMKHVMLLIKVKKIVI